MIKEKAHEVIVDHEGRTTSNQDATNGKKRVQKLECKKTFGGEMGKPGS
jgi:hypothetical protein